MAFFGGQIRGSTRAGGVFVHNRGTVAYFFLETIIKLKIIKQKTKQIK